ncbi:uncharacterized protein LOC135844213 [Planococcus citri]|uniref:uncharacterized protein LOC135844213 n=1 Tax=Planococcus citri TaxID=170843 RepID=UPI0031F96054
MLRMRRIILENENDMKKFEKKYCGYCSEGHLHWFTPKAAERWERIKNHAPDRDSYPNQFAAHMFERDFFEERTHAKLEDEFVSLIPTNCPLLEFNFLDEDIDRLLHCQADIPNTVAPFRSDGDRTPNAVVYVQEFERTAFGPRFRRETAIQCKRSFYELVREKFYLGDDDEIDDIPYATLRQNFLRKFCSRDVQNEILERFRNANIPADGTARREFLIHWAWQFTCITIELSRNIVDLMKMKIPLVNRAQRKFIGRYEKGVVSWPKFYKDLVDHRAFPIPPEIVPQQNTFVISLNTAVTLVCCCAIIVYGIVKIKKGS